MCRFALYVGAEISVESILTQPHNSIVHQSFHSHERAEPLNGDGFGMAWYVDGHAEPAIFKDVTPAWSNLNLMNLARVTRTRSLLAHVRAASPGLPVQQLNCHPFAWQNLAFMHNGTVGGFAQIRRALLRELDDEAFAAIQGTTDSEHVFALATQHYREASEEPPLARLASSLRAAITRTEALREAAGIKTPSLLNLALSDGKRAVVTRFISEGDEEPNSLYVHSGSRYTCEGGVCRMVDPGTEGHAVIVASEPLSEDAGWTRVPKNHLVTIDASLDVEVASI